MAFTQTAITSVSILRDMGEILVSWATTAPAGTLYQVYVDKSLAWEGTDTAAYLHAPDGPARIDVGGVDPDEAGTDLSGSLPTLAGRKRAKLTWYGGTYIDPEIASYRVYGEARAGGGVAYSTILATVPAYLTTTPDDGAGVGPAGQGGAGYAASEYEWTSRPLSGGTWTFAVRPVDSAGNEGTGTTTAVVIAAPPDPPAPFTDGKRLHVAYSGGTGKATLTWNASP